MRSLFVFDSFLHFFTTNVHAKNFRYIMSNPVVFFDMEIGGQPAGRIEMTVRIRIVSVLFFMQSVSFFFSRKR